MFALPICLTVLLVSLTGGNCCFCSGRATFLNQGTNFSFQVQLFYEKSGTPDQTLFIKPNRSSVIEFAYGTLVTYLFGQPSAIFHKRIRKGEAISQFLLDQTRVHLFTRANECWIIKGNFTKQTIEDGFDACSQYRSITTREEKAANAGKYDGNDDQPNK